MQMPSDAELKNMSLPELQNLLLSKEQELAQQIGELEMLENQDMKEEKEFKPHMMFDPKSGDQKQAMTEAEHNALEAKGYVHEDQLPAKEMAAEPMAAAPTVQMDEFGMGLTPEKVQSATAMLVDAGMLEAVTGEITPELISAMQMIAELIDPGLYDLSQPEQLEEFINGINDGTIPLTAQPAPATAAAPIGQPALGGGQPAGLPAGAIGAPALGAPAPIL